MKDTAGFSRVVLGVVVILVAVLVAILVFPRQPATAQNSAAASQAATQGADAGLAASGTSSADDAARRAAIAAQGGVKNRGTNAADLYKRAGTLYGQLTTDEKGLLRSSLKDIPPDQAAALYAKLQAIMDLLRQARKADYFDWGTGQMNFDTVIGPRVQIERDLSTAALWEAGYRFQNDAAGAVGDLAALEAMGRNGVDSLLGVALQSSSHQSILNLLAQNVGSLASDSSGELSYLMNTAAVQTEYQAGMNAESAMLQASIADYNNPATRDQSVLGKWMAAGGIKPPTAAEVQWLENTEQVLGASLQQPDAQFQQWWAQQVAQAASMPFASQAMTPLGASRSTVEKALVGNAMLQAGLALEQNDQAAFQSITDPVSRQPFTYTQRPGGFQLGTTTQFNGKSLTLNFNVPAAK